jgi:hypothetical protein
MARHTSSFNWENKHVKYYVKVDIYFDCSKFILQGPAGRRDIFVMGIKVGVRGIAHAQWLAVTRC